MNDTSPKVDALVRELLLRKTPEERFRMVGEMFAATRAFMEMGLEAQGLKRGTAAWKLAILDRTYGDEISASQRARLIQRWTADEQSAVDSSGT
jgi:hypothetical protein